MKSNSAKSGSPAEVFSQNFVDAVKFALEHHSKQSRKGTDTPYIGHPLHVAAYVIDAGGDEEVVIAALLHDVVEDQGGLPRLTEIGKNFGSRVAQIVESCSDSMEDPKPPWRGRKVAYVEHLLSASADVRLVSAADKLSNARSILSDLKTIGDKVWDRFNAPKDDQLWYYYSVIFALQDAPADSRVATLLRELIDVVREIRGLSGGPDIQELLDEAASCGGPGWEYQRAIQLTRMALIDGAESSQLADGLQLIEKCVQKLEAANDEVAEAQEQARSHSQNGEKLYSLGMVLSRAGDVAGSTAAYEQALEYKNSMCVDSLRACLNNIGWNCLRRGDYKSSLKWFKRSFATVDPEDSKPYALALENTILANARLGLVPVVAKLTEEYVSLIGRLPRYESRVVGKLGIDADLMFIEHAGRTPSQK